MEQGGDAIQEDVGIHGLGQVGSDPSGARCVAQGAAVVGGEQDDRHRTGAGVTEGAAYVQAVHIR
jgi:hypothetical protein